VQTDWVIAPPARARSRIVVVEDAFAVRGPLQTLAEGRDVVIVSDRGVAPHHLPSLEASLHPRRSASVILPQGERTKTARTAYALAGRLLREGFGRDTLLIGLGGGMVGDLTGFVASIYLRGVEYALVPTTLLAQVDAALGGKTGVDHPLAKNALGAFCFPTLVAVDARLLSTLEERHYRAGFAEVVKYALAFDVSFLTWLEEHAQGLRSRRPEDVTEAVARSIRHKIEIVGRDPYEEGERALLNLGHTFAHAIETHDGYARWLHGEAVAVGLDLAAECSRRFGWITDADRARVSALLRSLGLSTEPPTADPESIRALMTRDKKVRAGKLRMIFLQRLGRAVMSADYDERILAEVLAESFGPRRSEGAP
jgi:3-dehydroquinate synthase